MERQKYFLILGFVLFTNIIISAQLDTCYLPLAVGNKWVYLNRETDVQLMGTFYSRSYYSFIYANVTEEKVLNGMTYYKYDNIWLRYDKTNNKAYKLVSNNNEVLYVDFNLPDQTHYSSYFDTNSVALVKEFAFLGNTAWCKGITFYEYYYHVAVKHSYLFANNYGLVNYEDLTSSMFGSSLTNKTLIGFYSADTTLGYSKQDEAAPVISEPVITASGQNNLNVLVTVKHKFSLVNDNITILGGCCFIQSVILDYFYYKRGDTIRYPSVVMNNSTEIKYNTSLVLRNDLFLNGYLLNYKITATDKAIFPHVTVYTGGGFTGIDDNDNNIPCEYSLNQNYPNPFNPSTTIEFNIPESGDVQLGVYDVLGKEVAVLINNSLDAGNHKVNFSAANLSSGVYFYSLKFNGKQTITKKMILAK